MESKNTSEDNIEDIIKNSKDDNWEIKLKEYLDEIKKKDEFIYT